MADNIAVTAGSGTTIATEDEGGVHYQKVKLTASGTGTTADLTVAEDAAHSTGQHGILAMVVRNDTLAALAGTDGDNSPLQVNASGALYIQEGSAIDVSAATVTVDGTGTFVTQINGDALTALQLIDNIVQVEDAVHSTGASGVMSLAVRNDTLAALAGTDGDYAPLQVNASGALFIQEGAAMDVSAATVTVDNGGTFAVQSTLQTGSNAIGKLAANSGVDIGDVDILSIAAGDNNIGNVDIASALPAGTNAIGKLAANSGVDIGDVDVTSSVLPTGSGTMGSGRAVNSVAGTPVQFGANACKKVWVTAETNNSGAIWIGDANIVQTVGSERGLIAYQGQTVGPFELSNTNVLYVDAVTSGDGCTFVYIT